MINDRIRAQRLLRSKAKGGKLGLKAVLFTKYQLIWLAFISLLIFTDYQSSDESFHTSTITCIFIGIFVGRIIRDNAWVRDLNKSADFVMRIINWEKVEEISKESEVEPSH